MAERETMIKIMKETCNHAFLATCECDKPYVRSVAPIVEEDGSAWVTTFANSRKVKQIKQNPKICLYFVSRPNGEKVASPLT
ncbi:MAG TPA: hypothetical protein EYP58_00555 [bacterium (Candidatus Stahlbacteria)]|nr:hypothetical protein [Candidatus Stahlbacteria bacterium]